jgi:exodeoxyribonuclease III
MKVVTWNVNGIRARKDQVLALLAEEAPDVVCLQETRASPEQVPEALAAAAGYHCHWHGHKGYSGVGLLLKATRFADPPELQALSFDFETRIVAVAAGSMVLASVYVPNGGKDFAAKMQFLGELEAWVGRIRAEGRTLVLCGDLNVALTDIDVHPIDRRRMVGQLPEERALISKLLGHGLVDVVRFVAPEDDRLFTWWAPWRNMRQRNIGWRIDYVAAAKELVDASVTCVSRREFGTSDHGPVVATLLEP